MLQLQLPPRHEEEYARLMQRLDRSNGKWDTSHPRYRLLNALYSYAKYKGRSLAEVKRWRDLYQHVPKRQRSVLGRQTVDEDGD